MPNNRSGYEVLKGSRLKKFVEIAISLDAPDMNVGNISNRTSQLPIFDFKSFLNIGMLLVESENARLLRQTMLNIVIDFINKKTGGSTKYINQRDRDFLPAYLQEEDYRREFTDALRDYIDMGQFKLEIHRPTVKNSGGGSYGSLDLGRLESVLEHIKNDEYYPLLLDKIVHLFFCACKFHCFEDGDERVEKCHIML